MTKEFKITLIGLLALIFLVLLISPSSNPDSLLYPIKRLQEKKFLTLKSGDARWVYMNKLIDTRLSELSYLVNNKKYFKVLKSSLRYSTQVGELVDLTKSLNDPQKVDQLKDKLQKHRQIVDDLYNNYPDKDDSERKYVLDDVNYIDLYLKKL